MLMKTGIFYFTTCFHGFGILRHVNPFVRMLHIQCFHTKCRIFLGIELISFKSILEQLEKYLIVQPSEWKLNTILPYTILKKLARLDEYFVRYFDFCVTGLMAFLPKF